MPSILKRAGTAALATCALLLLAANSASAKTVDGTVVHRNVRAHAFVVASPGGHLTALHARRLPAVGRVVRASAHRLHNGTFAARHLDLRGHRGRARILGSVTFVDPRKDSFVVSTKGASIPVQGPASGRGAVGSSLGSLPTVGTVVKVEAGLDGEGNLEAENIQQLGEGTGPVELEGVVLAVEPTSRILRVSADDSNELGQSIVVQVPEEFEIGAFQVGQEVSLTVMPGTEGFVLAGSSCDGSAQEANERGSEQGDQESGEEQADGEGSGDSGQQGGTSQESSDEGQAGSGEGTAGSRSDSGSAEGEGQAREGQGGSGD